MSGIRSTGVLPQWALDEVVENRPAKLAIGIAAFVAATTFGAYVAVPLPFTPVPVTLQPLFVILAGALLGPWAGAGAMATYLALGAAGAPVFSGGGGGLAWLAGPTGGYLVAYPAAAFLVGALVRPSGSWIRTLSALTLGVALLYLGGISQLWILTGEDLSTLLAAGALPFIPGDVAKILLAFGIVRGIRRTRSERDSGGS